MMDLWTTETHQDMRLGFRTQQALYHAVSPFQAVDIVKTTRYGNLLLLDGAVMTTDVDEFVYHEMIAHVPMLSHPNPKRVLVIGGGDGGTVREVVKHAAVEEVVLCEIDGLVVESCKQHFPQIAGELDNPKVKVMIGDGIAYMAEQAANFDVIIIDSSDPVGPAEGLFTEEFYRNTFNALNPDGIMVAQTESPFVCQELIKAIYPIYNKLFPIVKMYHGHIPTYPSGFWTWAFCSKQHDAVLSEEAMARGKSLEKGLKYYNTELHAAAFVLPNFVRDLLKTPAAV